MLTIEYDSSGGSPEFFVYDGERYLGLIHYIANGQATFRGCDLMSIGEQAVILVRLLKQIEEKPLTMENYPKGD